jgi:hypothetical protein
MMFLVMRRDLVNKVIGVSTKSPTQRVQNRSTVAGRIRCLSGGARRAVGDLRQVRRRISQGNHRRSKYGL